MVNFVHLYGMVVYDFIHSALLTLFCFVFTYCMALISVRARQPLIITLVWLCLDAVKANLQLPIDNLPDISQT